MNLLGPEFILYKEMINNLNISKLIEVEKQIIKNQKLARQSIPQSVRHVQFKQLPERQYEVFYKILITHRCKLSKIDFIRLESIVSEISDKAHRVGDVILRINKNIGSELGKDSLFGNIIATFYLKSQEGDEPTPKEDKLLLKQITEHESKLISCFDLIEDQTILEYEELVGELLTVHKYCSNEGNESLAKIEEYLRKFIKGLIDNSANDDDEKTVVASKIIRSFLDKFHTNIPSQLDKDKTDASLNMTSVFKKAALDLKSKEILKSIVATTQTIYFRLLISSTKYEPALVTAVLEMGYLGIREVRDDAKSYDVKEIEFIRDVNLTIIEASVLLVYYIIRYSYHRPQVEVKKYLVENLRYLGSATLSLYNEKQIGNLYAELTDHLAKRKIGLAISIFKEADYGRLDKSFAYEIAFQLAEDAKELFGEHGESKISEFLLEESVLKMNDIFKQEWCEERRVTETEEEYYPHFWSPYGFWVCYSIYRKIAWGKNFFPIRYTANANSVLIANYYIVDRLQSIIPDLDVDQVIALVGMKPDRIRKEIEEYREHLSGLIKENNANVEKMFSTAKKG